MRALFCVIALALVFTLGCQQDKSLNEPTQRPSYETTYARPEPIEAVESQPVTIASEPSTPTMRQPIAGTGTTSSGELGPAGDTSTTTRYRSHSERQTTLDRMETVQTEIAPAQPAGFSYTLKRGDTLWQLSERYLGAGSRWREIRDANPGLKPEALPIGKDIWIPAK
jgi:nucleoid-associated protein YgaU